MWSNGRSEAELEAALPLPIDIRHYRRSRRLRLRYDSARQRLSLSCPTRTSRRAALSWAVEQREWIDRAIADTPQSAPFEPDGVIPLTGREIRLEWNSAMPRIVSQIGDSLVCGGPRESFSRRISAYLKALALETMSTDVADYCATAGVRPRSVRIGDAATRWGSCNQHGDIRLSWRLILAPPDVRRYVVAHEVAHLVHLDHSARFKALERSLYGPGVQRAQASLRNIGPRLRRVGLGV